MNLKTRLRNKLIKVLAGDSMIIINAQITTSSVFPLPLNESASTYIYNLILDGTPIELRGDYGFDILYKTNDARARPHGGGGEEGRGIN